MLDECMYVCTKNTHTHTPTHTHEDAHKTHTLMKNTQHICTHNIYTHTLHATFKVQESLHKSVFMRAIVHYAVCTLLVQAAG